MTSFTDLGRYDKTIVLGDKEYALTPLRIGEIPKVVHALRPLISKGDVDVSSALLEYPDQVREFVNIASRIDSDILDKLPLDDFIRLTVAVFEVNLLFFSERVVPALEEASDSLTKQTSRQAGTPP